jgi:hypothetical protein
MRFSEIISEDANPKRQAAIAIAMKKAGKKPKDVAEDRENFNGINLLLQKDDEEVFVKASAGSRELGHVLFVMDGDYLMPQDLEVEERYRGQGIAQTMYDFVKSKGYKIRRSGQQTDAGAGFWAKHRPEQNVWEEGVAEGSLNELSSGLLQRAAQAATDKRNQAMDPELHNALGGGYMNPLARHYDDVSQKMDNRAAQVRKKETIQNTVSKIASPAVMRKMGIAKEGVAEGLSEMDNRTPSGDRREKHNNSPEEKAKQNKEQQKRLKDTSPKMRKKLRLPEPKEGVAEGSGGNWYIRVNGKILNDTKFKPVIFSSEDEARSHAMKLADKKRIPLSQMKLTKSWMDAPEQGVAEGENWSKHNNKRVGGMSKKSVSSYRRSHPGSKIQTAVTTKPSKLKKGSKSAKRRASFCARMRGMKKHRTGAKTAHDPNSNINKSLRRWHCESIEELQELVMIAEQFIRNNKK